MRDCRQLKRGVKWAAQGNEYPLPDELRQHAVRCGECGSFIREIERGRELGQLLPVTVIEQSRHDAVRFRLMAAARQSGNICELPSRRVALRVRLLAVALAATAAAGAATMAKRYAETNANQATSAGQSNVAAVAKPLARFTSRSVSSRVEQAITPVYSRFTAEPPNRLTTRGASAAASGSRQDGSGASNVESDAGFAEAWAVLRSKRPAEAAKRFDGLLGSGSLDAARRADVLYWSAQAHRQAGNAQMAMSRSSQLLRQYPSAPFASDAALLLGEYALASDQFDSAAQYLNRAARSERAVVRERAKRALQQLVKKHSQ